MKRKYESKINPDLQVKRNAKFRVAEWVEKTHSEKSEIQNDSKKSMLRKDWHGMRGYSVCGMACLSKKKRKMNEKQKQ